MAHLTPFQESLHLPEAPAKGPDYPGNILHSEFVPENRRATWYSHTTAELKRQELEPNVWEFVPTGEALAVTDLSFTLPAVRCKPGYEASWLPKEAFCLKGELYLGSTLVETLNATWLMWHRREVEVPRWAAEFPSRVCSVLLPWLYSQDVSHALPLKIPARHVLTFRPLSECLRCRNVERNVLVPLEEGVEPFEAKLEPTLWGEYVTFSDLERSYKGESPYVVQYANIIPLEAEGSSVLTFELPEVPIVGLVWTAPGVISTALESKTGTIFDVPGWRTENVYPARCYPNRPRQPGFHLWSMSLSGTSLNPPPGMVLKEGRLKVRVQEATSGSLCVMMTQRLTLQGRTVTVEC